MNVDHASHHGPAAVSMKKSGISHKTIDAITSGIAKAIKPILQEHATTLAALTARITGLEQQITKGARLAFKGQWQGGDAYPTGAAVQFDGGLWISTRQTSETPGTGDGWVLAVRRGREGKPGRDGKDCPNCRAAS